MSFCELFSDFLSKFDKYVSRMYVLSDTAFTRKGTWDLKTAIMYPLCSNKKTKFRDVNKFLKQNKGDYTESITGSGVCDRMQYINPQVYIDMLDDLVKEIYKNKDLHRFKGKLIAAIDSSQLDIPNRPETRCQMGIPEDTIFEKYDVKVRLSCMVDALSDFVISASLSNLFTDEITHALQHLDDANTKIDLKNVITTYDRFYSSIELMMKTMLYESFFLIRGKKSVFKDEQEYMKKHNLKDAIFEINLTESLIKKFRGDDLQDFARKMGRMTIRIVFVKLNTGETEILFTNLDKDFATPTELKEMYGDRWTIEKDFDRLKNKLYFEKFTGRRKVIIEQDCYSHIFLFNLMIGIKHDAESKITRKPKKTAKYKYTYHSNVNVLIGEIKDILPQLLKGTKNQIKRLINQVIDVGKREVVATKIWSSRKKEDERKKFRHTNCPSNASMGF